MSYRASTGAALGLIFALLTVPVLAEEPRRGGTLTYAMFPEPSTLVNHNNTAQKIAGKITEGLLSYDYDLSPRPHLARAWTVSPDGLIYTFTLRDDVRWHDGKPFTSADVAFTIETFKQIHPRGRLAFAQVTEVRTPDPSTAIVVLAKPAPYLLASLAGSQIPILPRHVYEGSPIATNPANAHPIGTGPFVFKEWVRGSHVVLERNTDYWDKGKPYIDRLVTRFIPDAGARAAALESGEVDIAGDTPIAGPDLERLKSLPQLGSETKGYEYSGVLSQVVLNLDTPALKDLRVRQALAAAIDPRIVLNVAWYGYGELSPTVVIPAVKSFHDEAAKPYPIDLVRAEKLLDEAGLKRGSDGSRLALRLTYSPFFDGNRRTAEYIRQALARIGVSAAIAPYDQAQYVKTVYTDRAFDLSVEVVSNAPDPAQGVQRFYWSKNFKPGVPFSNGSHYANTDVDRLLEAGESETDPKKRREHYLAVQRQIYTDIPVINLISLKPVTIFKRTVRNHTVNAEGLNFNFADVYISEPAKNPK
ncbi:ABC transporter substrate-binding protein [Bosea sp. RCC_152_1]|uniref:ABC transporter substrate-binding protein n=1 Tax=Bosea sp. RCC_152_1 TaxID=3239228 RepID=UPI003523579B